MREREREREERERERERRGEGGGRVPGRCDRTTEGEIEKDGERKGRGWNTE